MANAFLSRGWDVCAWNFRGCSGEPNRLFRSYHSGATEDLDTVLQHVLGKKGYAQVVLVGFSLGGNLTLKYLGEQSVDVDDRVKGATVFSVPCDLASASRKLDKPSNLIYMLYFFRSLRRKMSWKAERFPELADPRVVRKMRTFHEFDSYYTAPAHGFSDAEDYWKRASSKPFLAEIRVSTLFVNALDDPFLAGPCFPYDAARENEYLTLLIPQYGGHVGFVSPGSSGVYWSEEVAAGFLETLVTHPQQRINEGSDT